MQKVRRDTVHLTHRYEGIGAHSEFLIAKVPFFAPGSPFGKVPLIFDLSLIARRATHNAFTPRHTAAVHDATTPGFAFSK